MRAEAGKEAGPWSLRAPALSSRFTNRDGAAAEGSVRPPLVTELGPEPGAPKARPWAPPLSTDFDQQQSVTWAVCPGGF